MKYLLVHLLIAVAITAVVVLCDSEEHHKNDGYQYDYDYGRFRRKLSYYDTTIAVKRCISSAVLINASNPSQNQASLTIIKLIWFKTNIMISTYNIFCDLPFFHRRMDTIIYMKNIGL